MAIEWLLTRPLQKCSKCLANLGKLYFSGRWGVYKYIHFLKMERPGFDLNIAQATLSVGARN